jgi:hypothetical protein
MILHLITGLIALVMVFSFLGFMVWWVPALPLIIIVVGVMLLLAYDYVQTVRLGENYAERK